MTLENPASFERKKLTTGINDIRGKIAVLALSLFINSGIFSIYSYLASSKENSDGEKVENPNHGSPTKEKLVQKIQRARDAKNLNYIDKNQFVFEAEQVEIIRRDGIKSATPKLEQAQKRYQSLVQKITKMKMDGRSIEEIFSFILRFFGEYDMKSSFVTDLLIEGRGNCEARGKLAFMAVEEVFGDEVETSIQITNIQNPETEKAIQHTRTIVIKDGKYYLFDLPGIIVLTEKQFHSQFSDVTLLPTDSIFDAYMVAMEEEKYSPLLESRPPIESENISTNSIFIFPGSRALEQGNGNYEGNLAKMTELDDKIAIHLGDPDEIVRKLKEEERKKEEEEKRLAKAKKISEEGKVDPVVAQADDDKREDLRREMCIKNENEQANSREKISDRIVEADRENLKRDVEDLEARLEAFIKEKEQLHIDMLTRILSKEEIPPYDLKFVIGILTLVSDIERDPEAAKDNERLIELVKSLKHPQILEYLRKHKKNE